MIQAHRAFSIRRRRWPLTVGLLLAAAATHAAGPAIQACDQQGMLPAMPPFMPKPIQIHECTSFSGGAQAAEVAKSWCENASRPPMEGAPPPKVTMVAACAAGALARCDVATPGSDVVISRHFYVADAGAGGLEGLRKSCEGSGKAIKGLPTGKWTQF